MPHSLTNFHVPWIKKSQKVLNVDIGLPFGGYNNQNLSYSQIPFSDLQWLKITEQHLNFNKKQGALNQKY